MLYVLPFVCMVKYFFLILYMLLTHIDDYNVCKTYFVSLTNKENITFDTTPFRDIDKTQIYPYHHDLYIPP